MPDPTDVTATVCNYNGRAYLGDCLPALLDQTSPPARVVVYDNDSKDESVAYVRSEFPEVEVVAMGGNQGPGAPRNRGLREAGTKYVLQVDSDVILERECLEQLHEEAEATFAAVTMPRTLFDHERSRIHYDGGLFHCRRRHDAPQLLRADLAERREPRSRRRRLDVDAVIATALLLRRDAVSAAGGYDLDYFISSRTTTSYRLRARGDGCGCSCMRSPSTGRGRRASPIARARVPGAARLPAQPQPLAPPAAQPFDARAAARPSRDPRLRPVWFGFALTQGLVKPWVDGKRDIFGSGARSGRSAARSSARAASATACCCRRSR